MPLIKAPIALSIILGFLSGYIDTAVFLHMQGLFVAHVTGNVVLLGAMLAGSGEEGMNPGSAALHLISFPVFFFSASFAAIIAEKAGGRQTVTLLGIATLIFAIVSAAALMGSRLDALLATLLVVAMGVLNAAHRLEAVTGPPFTMMTGNVTGVAIHIVHSCGLGPPGQATPAGWSERSIALLVCAFVAGCAFGAFMQTLLGLGAMIVPAMLLLTACLVNSKDAARSPA
ncbi:MAG: YoaK family protein [Pseudomonadota bacterium]